MSVCGEFMRENGARALFSYQTMLAPMEGVTSAPIRALLSRYGGLDAVCTEFVRVGTNPPTDKELRCHVLKAPGVGLSVQLMGNDSRWMASAAGVLNRAGADVVDINLGCPTKRAVKGGVGAAMLRDLGLLYEVLSGMRAAVDGLLSAKIRAGFDDSDGALEIAQTVERAGADFIVIHPRTRRDAYLGIADWRIVKHVKQHVGIPVVGNGDCWYAEDAISLQNETGCDGVMLGRPALRNPWVFRQLEDLRQGRMPYEPCGDDVFDYVCAVCDVLKPVGSGRGLLGKLKELFRYVGRAIPDERLLMRAALRAQSLDEFMVVVERGLRGICASDLDLLAHGAHRLEKSAATLLCCA